MPPIYTYIDNNSGKFVEVLRSLSEYDVPPTKEESTKKTAESNHEPMTEEEFDNADFERRIGAGITVTYAQGMLKGRM